MYTPPLVKLTILVSFLCIPTLALGFELPWKQTPPEDYFKGTNEFYDATKDPRYSQYYVEIGLDSNGINDQKTSNILKGLNLDDTKPTLHVKVLENDEQGFTTIELDSIANLKDQLQTTKSESIQEKISQIKEQELSFEKSQKITSLQSDPTIPTVRNITLNLDKDDPRLKDLQSIQKSENIEVNKDSIQNLLQENGQISTEELTTIAEDIKTLNITANKEVMDMLYPTEEEINELNAEIEAERRAHWEYNQSQITWQDKIKNSLQFLTAPFVKAGYLNNNVNNSVVYSYYNSGLALDLMGGGVHHGNEFQLYPRNNSAAQNFKMIDRNDANNQKNNGGEIKYANFAQTGQPGFCLDRAGNGYGNGVKVQLWDCNGTDAQLWRAYDDGTIRPAKNSSYCLDASSGVGQHSRIHLWQCHGGANQNFRIGNYDFTGYRYYMRIYARPDWNTEDVSDWGHAFVSVRRSDNYGITTFGFWNNLDTSNSNSGNRVNNMMNWVPSKNRWSNLHVDNSSDKTIAHSNNPSGLYGYGFKEIEISKSRHDEISHMNGYRLNNFVDADYQFCTHNCAKFTASLWNKYASSNDDVNARNVWSPICYSPAVILDSF